ncbi:hypothetical protein BJ986_003152 [Phycicoccus badiiscoriae]|uniref:Tetratricopeptide repeat protein n=1 Tax=Pedococcus badiiscoriae TaxID=642776 RepID=A0A852WR32_9MICO|nr:hypothetical protein [Pedococcus badiiscoriae]NYG08665.1 hypothetical protein [Pedococcus badiiscoriae]
MRDWTSITNAIALALSGERQRGREALLACWEATAQGDHAQRCVLAHYLADQRSALDEEVAWDEVAMSEHAYVVDEDLVPIGVTSAAALAPSLHLNLGDGYLRQGRLDDARAQLDAGMQAQSTLSIDGYGAHIRSGLERLRQRVEEVQLP